MNNNFDLQIIRHSTAHIMAIAVKKLFPETKIAIGPAIENGFYYDFDREESFTPIDLEKIENKMQEIIKENLSFIKKEISKEEALRFFENQGEVYKIEILKELQDSQITLYETGDFIDLCRGPHVNTTQDVRYFKLLSIAGAYWRGNEKNKMLQRIYGTAFLNKEELKNYLNKLQEAEKRDHRKLGKILELFSINEESGPGLIIWHPKGAIIRKIIEDFWKKEHLKRGYQLVNTPHIAKSNLWKVSGHLDFYKENMYSPILIENQEYILKPMNCPLHILIYKNKKHSYRELPMRLAELGTVYRYERSGVLHGMLRVRGFTQDDAHIFCAPEQLKEEILNCVKLAQFLMQSFGFKEYEVNLATRGEKFAGSLERWNEAENTLKLALEELKISFTTDPGGAVFYGPKIDIKIKDALGRAWQGPTIQFDFNLPERFGIYYVAQSGKENLVYMVHRAILGSLERFMGCLIEHYGGAFPLWLSPLQMIIFPINEKNFTYADTLKNILEENNFRLKCDFSKDNLNYKIKNAQKEKIPYMIIIGDAEEEKQKISLRSLKKGNLGLMDFNEFLVQIKKEREDKL